MDQKLKILQFNCDKGSNATSLIRNIVQKEGIDILLLQEPYMVDGAVSGLPKSWTQWPSKGGKAAILIVNKNILGTTYSIGQNTAAIKIALSNKEWIISTAYSSPYQPLQNTTDELHTLIGRVGSSPLLIGADLNGPHTTFGYRYTTPRGKKLLDFIRSENLVRLNDNKQPTFQNGEKKGSPDVTLINQAALIDNIGWRVDDEATLSLHKYIIATIEDKPKSTDTTNYSNSQRRINNFIRELRTKARTLERNIKQANNAAELENAVTNVFDTFRDIGDRTLLVTKVTAKVNNPWWNKDLETKRKIYRACKKRADRATVENKAMLWEVFSKHRAIYTKAVFRSRRHNWMGFCTEAIDPFGATYKATVKTKTLPPQLLMCEKDNIPLKEAAKRQLEKIFPTDVTGQANPAFRAPDPLENSRPQDEEPITKNEIERIVKNLKDKKATGHDGISNKLVKAINQAFPYLLHAMFNQCLNIGLFPKHFKVGKIILILKKGKDPADVKSYRPIHLLPTIGKILEKILVQRITFQTEKNKFWNKNQFGFRHGCSAENALLRIKEEIQKRQSRNLDTILLSLDIRGAFDALRHKVIAEKINCLPISAKMLKIIANLLEDRKAAINTPEGLVFHDITRGCPQGSCSGPLLWNAVIDALLKTAWPLNSWVQAFADDLAILVSASTILSTKALAEAVLQLIEEWMRAHDLEVAAEKSQYLWISKKTTPIRSLQTNGQRIARVDHLKYLGVHFDPKMNFFYHIGQQGNKVNKILPRLLSSAGATWGINRNMRRTLYIAVIQRIMAYAASVWASNLTKYKKEKLDSIQRGFLLYITKAYCTTPTNALQVITGLPPLSLWIEFEHKTGLLTRMRRDVDNIHHTQMVQRPTGWTAHPATNIPESQITLYHNKIPTKVEVYTDGSKTDEGTAAAYTMRTTDGSPATQWAQKLNPEATVFQAEMYALFEAINKARTIQQPVRIYSDSMSSLQAFKDPLTRHWPARLIRNILGSNPNIELSWVKAHEGVEGNEEADQLAKNATKRDLIDCHIPLPASWAKTKFRNGMMCKWQHRWEHHDKTGRKIHEVIPKVKMKDRGWTRSLVMFFSEHGPFPAYLKRFRIITNDNCKCGTLGTVLHYATQCPITQKYHFGLPSADNLPRWRAELLKKPERGKRIDQLITYLETNQEDFVIRDNHQRPRRRTNRATSEDDSS